MSGKVRYLAGWWLVLLLSVASLAAGNDLRLAEAVKNQDKAAVRSLLQENADANFGDASYVGPHRDGDKERRQDRGRRRKPVIEL